jgi:hypothetical protein
MSQKATTKPSVVLLGKVNAWDDGIPCYGSIQAFTNRDKAIDWLKQEYGENWEEMLNTKEEMDKAMNECTYGPTGYDIWTEEVN